MAIVHLLALVEIHNALIESCSDALVGNLSEVTGVELPDSGYNIKFSFISMPREQVEAVKRSLQDHYALAAHQFLQAAMSEEKVGESKAMDLMRMSALAHDRSGVPSSPIDDLVQALSKFQKKTPKDRATLDATSENTQSPVRSSMNPGQDA